MGKRINSILRLTTDDYLITSSLEIYCSFRKSKVRQQDWLRGSLIEHPDRPSRDRSRMTFVIIKTQHACRKRSTGISFLLINWTLSKLIMSCPSSDHLTSKLILFVPPVRSVHVTLCWFYCSSADAFPRSVSSPSIASCLRQLDVPD